MTKDDMRIVNEIRSLIPRCECELWDVDCDCTDIVISSPELEEMVSRGNRTSYIIALAYMEGGGELRVNHRGRGRENYVELLLERVTHRIDDIPF